MKMNFKHGEIITVTMVIWENNCENYSIFSLSMSQFKFLLWAFIV